MTTVDFRSVFDKVIECGDISPSQISYLRSLYEDDDFNMQIQLTDEGNGIDFSELGFWDQQVELKHLYRVRLGYIKEECPKCQNPTERYSATVLYSSKDELRQSLSPNAWVCTPCQTVLLDEHDIAFNNSNYTFLPVGIIEAGFHDRVSDPDFPIFETYEGQKPCFVIDDNGNLDEIVTGNAAEAFRKHEKMLMVSLKNKKKKSIKKRKDRKQARKRNRKH